MNIAPRNILELIPQAPPFVMVDELIYTDELISRSTFMITADNCLLSGGLFTEGGLLENIAQTAAARAGYAAKVEGKPILSGYVGAVNNMAIVFLPKAGSQISTEITITDRIFNVTVISGSVWCNNELAASCEMKLFLNEEE